MEMQLQTKDTLATLHLDPRTKLYLLIVGNVALFLAPSLLYEIAETVDCHVDHIKSLSVHFVAEPEIRYNLPHDRHLVVFKHFICHEYSPFLADRKSVV